MNNISLYEIAKNVMTTGKGVLASDESPKSADKNLIKAGIAPSPEMRQRYRELFINTPNLEKYLTGIILHDETFWQKDSTGKLFRETLIEKGIIVIIKVDEGTINLPNFPGEKITLGLDKLDTRLQKYYENGARMAKWRAVIKIDEATGLPTNADIEANASGLAEYALFCQKNGIVPIVEPEVLLNGPHSIEKAEEVTKKTLNTVFETLKNYEVDLKAVILKTSMVVPGDQNEAEVTSRKIAEATVRTLLECVPVELPGIVFLSGGQSPDETTENFNEIAKNEPLPWEIAFSYLRAIEGPPGVIWGGKDENVEAARAEFIRRLELNVLADKGLLP